MYICAYMCIFVYLCIWPFPCLKFVHSKIAESRVRANMFRISSCSGLHSSRDRLLIQDLSGLSIDISGRLNGAATLLVLMAGYWTIG